MTSEPKRPDSSSPDTSDNVVSLREARKRQSAAQPKPAPEKKMPVLLIFLGLLAILVAYKLLA